MVMDWYNIFRNQKEDEIIDIDFFKECIPTFLIFPNLMHEICRLPQNIEIIKFIVSKFGFQVFEKIHTKQCKYTPLFFAARNGCLEICELITKTNPYFLPSAHISPKSKSNPLHIAAVNGQREICDFFLQNDFFSIHSRDCDGWTPLHYAVQESKNLSLVQHLVENCNADINAVNTSFQSSVLYIACQKNENVDIVRYLCRRGANVNHANMYLWTPLHIASKQGNKDICEILLEYGADKNFLNSKGQNPFSVSGDLKTCAFLGKGFDCDVMYSTVIPTWKMDFFKKYERVKKEIKFLLFMLF